MKEAAGRSIFTRIIMVFFCSLFFIYCVMAWLLIRNTNATRNDFLESRRMQAQSYIEDLDRQLNAFYMQESYLVHNRDIRKLTYSLYNSDYDKYQLILSATRTLSDIRAISPLIEDVAVYFPTQEIVLSSLNGYSYEHIDTSTYISGETLLSNLIQRNNKLFMQIAYPLTHSLSTDYTPDVVITIALDTSEIGETLKIFSDDAGSGAALVYNKALVAGNMDESIITNYIYNSDKKAQSLKAGKESYRVEILSSASYPLELLVSVNNKTLIQIITQDILLLTLVTILAGIAFIVSLIYTRKLIHEPLSKMVDAFEELQEGRFDVRISHKSQDEFHFIYRAFNETVENLHQLIEKVVEQDKLINAAELAQLQSQINPHFLYNSFFIIDRMSKNEEYEQISAFVTSLARYYRFLNKVQQDNISLKDEVEHMCNYIDIQQMRFGDKITVERAELPKDIENTAVPKLILQPIIENAYEYGLKDKLDNGLIRVSYISAAEFLDIIVEDNGECALEDILRVKERLGGIDDSEKSHALYNINRRLKLANGPLSGTFIDKSPLGGFRVRLHLQRESKELMSRTDK